MSFNAITGGFSQNPLSGPLRSILGMNTFDPSSMGMPGFQPGMGSQGISNVKPIGPISPILSSINNPNAYQAQDMMSEPLKEYDLARSNLNSQLSSQQSGARDQMARQFASLGGGPGGAAIKQTELLNNDFANQRTQGMGNIDMQEAMQRRALQQNESNKEFQSGEAFNQRAFQGSQAQRQQELQLGEFNQGNAIAQNQAQFDNATKLRSLDLGAYQAQLQATQDAYNQELSRYQANNQGGLLGSGGILGTGIKL